MSTLAYVYKWIHIPTNKWYIGSRTAKNCHPDDGYICSSKSVKPMILENKIDWKREIIATGSPKDMLHLEANLLQKYNARDNINSFNRHNNDGKFSSLGNPNGNCGAPQGTMPWNKGLNTINGSMARRKPNTNYRSDKGSIKLNQRGPAMVSYYGYYIDPMGNKYVSAYKASKEYMVARHTISRWAKSNKNGWAYIPKNLGASEINEQILKGEINV